MRRASLLAATFAVASLVTVTGCSSGAGAAGAASPGAAGSTATVSVVASTNVYGDIVQAVGGDAVTVTSIISSPDRDPHEYEADAQTQLALSKAQLVVENGGGYDDFVDTMLSSAPSKPVTINVTDLSGYDQEPADGEFNEHLWYDLPTVAKLATRLSTDLAAAAPAQAATFAANAKTFTAQLQKLQEQEAALKAEHGGEGVAITEPVPGYLLAAAGLTNKTPAEFSEAIEEDTDVPPAALKQTLDLFDQRQVALLAYNEQTSGPQTEAVLAAAERHDIPVVPVTETLPEGQSYLTWMQATITAVGDALGTS